jgi:aldose sugar dehydrogenase
VRALIRTPLAVVFVAALAVGSCTVPAPALSVSTVLSGLHRPWDLAFTPDGGMLFTEKGGAIRFRHRDGLFVRTLADPIDSIVMGEGGMMGVAVDPSFQSNRRVYTCFLSNLGGAPDVRVVRWRMNEAVTALTDRVDIVTGIPVTSGRHSGCRTRFGPDGRLWIGTGDAASPTVPQSPTSLGGKVLRVDTSGQGVPGNAPAPFDPRIYTYGHRNVQGIAFSPGGNAYSIEHGTDRDDEVNRLFAGSNYGWDPRPLSGPMRYDESRPMTDTVRHPGARGAVWSSGFPTIAPSGGDFTRGPVWDGSLAMAVLKGQQLRVLRLDNNGLAWVTQWVSITDQGRLRVAVMHPSNGHLYLATDSDPGRIFRVIPS